MQNVMEDVEFEGALFNPAAQCMRHYSGKIAGPSLARACDFCGRPFALHYIVRGVFTVTPGPAEDTLLRFLAESATTPSGVEIEYEIRLRERPRDRVNRALDALERLGKGSE